MEANKNKFRETDIRPSDIMAGQIKHIEADRERLLSHKHKFVTVSCPACGCENSRIEFIKNGLKYVTCTCCETMFVNPRPTSEILEECYSKSSVYEFWNKYVYPVTDKARCEGIYRPRVERILNICKNYGFTNCTLMEVGAGFGSFCDEVNNTGYFDRVIAVEPTPDGAESCRKKNVEVIEKPIEKVSIDKGKVDIIVSFEVIEHLFSPKTFLINCSNLLRTGGLIIVTCPNIRGFDNLVLGKLSSTIDHEHLNYFHPESLALLMSNCGFRLVEKLTPGKLDAELVRNEVLKGAFSLKNKPFLKYLLIDKWNETNENFQNFLADNLLSGHMWMVALMK
ncbi:MAG: class I SAM-dependent methyltransferase [Deltaproteobacteria bacterium]|nr:class I SAM-dependent methyltransferase [Deltaproteobacteria bacterium]